MLFFKTLYRPNLAETKQMTYVGTVLSFMTCYHILMLELNL